MTPCLYDLFIAHSSADLQLAEDLFNCIAGRVRVFLDSQSLQLGDDWDLVIPSAQLASRVTVVLISPNSSSAYYERDEVRAAISLSRSKAGKHRVVPIFTDKAEMQDNGTHYGLRLKHGLLLSQNLTMRDAAEKLVSLIKQLQEADGDTLARREIALPPITRPTPAKPKPTLALEAIRQRLRELGIFRLLEKEAIQAVKLANHLTEAEAMELVTVLAATGYLKRASGGRLEISLAGLHLLTKGAS